MTSNFNDNEKKIDTKIYTCMVTKLHLLNKQCVLVTKAPISDMGE